ncbi:MAG: amidohydrolase [Azospirillaceae bacterium]|nr:amidohydrolase [Azospirillaceae bacterium]
MNEHKAAEVADIIPSIQAIRRDLHRHPELAFAETRTAALVASELLAAGFEVTQGVGGTGVVGTLRAGLSGRAVALRADMDGLPALEQTGLPYASSTPGLMHACGHDGHTAMLLGAARQLARTRRFNGTVHVVFQPAEEKGRDSGAPRMIADGLFERFPADAVFAMHTHPGIPTGTFLVRPGPFMAASDRITIDVQGRSGHAGRPHLTADALVAASGIVTALQSIVARNANPIDPAVVTVGILQSGTAYNVVPGNAHLELSVRSFSEQTRTLLRDRIASLAVAQATSYGARATVDYQPGYPVLQNSAAATAFAAGVARELVGPGAVTDDAAPMMASEDFAYMLQERPGCLLRLGNGIDSSPVHHPCYDFDDANLPIGIAFWTRLVERFLPTTQTAPHATPGA